MGSYHFRTKVKNPMMAASSFGPCRIKREATLMDSFSENTYRSSPRKNTSDSTELSTWKAGRL
jgi:hypothetical protein